MTSEPDYHSLGYLKEQALWHRYREQYAKNRMGTRPEWKRKMLSHRGQAENYEREPERREIYHGE
jgi:hypothetical protein